MPDASSKSLVRPELELECEIWGDGLVQAEGTAKGRAFYFRARHPNWTFEMEDDLGQLPSDVGGNQIMFVEGWYSNTYEMSPAQAGRIIEQCAAMYGRLQAL